MPAISRRRGSAASLIRGLTGGAPFCSGGNFRIGSAIALLLLRWRARWILNGVADVCLVGFQLREQAVRIGRIDALERGRGQLRAQPAQFSQQLAPGLAQIEAVDAA